MSPAGIPRAAILPILLDIAPDEDLSGLKDDAFRCASRWNLSCMDFLISSAELQKSYRIQIPRRHYVRVFLDDQHGEISGPPR